MFLFFKMVYSVSVCAIGLLGLLLLPKMPEAAAGKKQ